MTQLEQILKNLQLQIDSLNRDVRDLKIENQRLKSKIGIRNNDMKFIRS